MPNDDTAGPPRPVAPAATAGPRSAAATAPADPVDVRRRRARRAGSPAARPCSQRQHHLDDAGDAGRGLGVADVGLHRAEPERRSAARSWPYAASSARASIGSPSGGAGAVRLDVRRRRPGRSPARSSAARITRSWAGPFGAVRPLAAAVLVDRRAADHREDRVAVAPRVGQPLAARARRTPSPQHDAVGRVGERLAPPVGRQPALAAERRRCSSGASITVDAAGQRQRRTRRRAAPGPRGATATSDDEQAVSTVSAGPCRPST